MAKGMHPVPSEPASSAAYNTSMGHPGTEEEEKKSTETRENPKKKKDVIITVYVESPSPPPPPPPPPIHVHKKGNGDHTNKKNKSKPFPKTGGYDRRAQLLAYAKELRNVDTKQPEWPKTSLPKPKHKITCGKSLITSVRIQRVTRNRKRYQQLVPEVDISCRPKSIIGDKKKKKSNRQSDSPIVGRLRRILQRIRRNAQRIICYHQVVSV